MKMRLYEMIFKTAGVSGKPIILIVHAMFMSYNMYNELIKLLKDNYYIILPVLDGHDLCETSAFISAEDEAKKIISYLNENDISQIDILLGTSLGEIIAFEVFRKKEVNVRKLFLDGAPFILFLILKYA